MKTNSIYDDFWNMSKGIEFPFEKYGITWDKNASEEERHETLLKQLTKLGLSEHHAIELIAKTFDPDQIYY